MQRESFELACSEARRKLDDQLASVDSADQKTGILMGFAAVLLALLLNLDGPCTEQLALRLIAQGLVLGSLIALFLSFRPVTMHLGLTVDAFLELMTRAAPHDDTEVLLKYHLRYLNAALKANNRLIARKSAQLKVGALLLMLGVALAVVGSYITGG